MPTGMALASFGPATSRIPGALHADADQVTVVRYAGLRRPRYSISSILCTAPSGRVSPTPMVMMRFKNAYRSADVSNLGTVRK